MAAALFLSQTRSHAGKRGVLQSVSKTFVISSLNCPISPLLLFRWFLAMTHQFKANYRPLLDEGRESASDLHPSRSPPCCSHHRNRLSLAAWLLIVQTLNLLLFSSLLLWAIHSCHDAETTKTDPCAIPPSRPPIPRTNQAFYQTTASTTTPPQ